jgi:hypothetical protein
MVRYFDMVDKANSGFIQKGKSETPFGFWSRQAIS